MKGNLFCVIVLLLLSLRCGNALHDSYSWGIQEQLNGGEQPPQLGHVEGEILDTAEFLRGRDLSEEEERIVREWELLIKQAIQPQGLLNRILGVLGGLVGQQDQGELMQRLIAQQPWPVDYERILAIPEELPPDANRSGIICDFYRLCTEKFPPEQFYRPSAHAINLSRLCIMVTCAGPPITREHASAITRNVLERGLDINRMELNGNIPLIGLLITGSLGGLEAVVDYTVEGEGVQEINWAGVVDFLTEDRLRDLPVLNAQQLVRLLDQGHLHLGVQRDQMLRNRAHEE